MLRRSWHVLCWLTGAAATLCLVVAVLVPRLAGATPYTVLTGSMRPGMPPGTLVVVRPVDPDRVGVGTVVTYQLTSGQPAVVTHRVVAVTTGADGQPLFRTQGDANPSPDPAWVRPVQLKGERWYSVRYLGYLSEVLTGAQRRTAIEVVAGLLFAYAALMFAAGLRGSRRRRTEPEAIHV